MFRNLSRYEAYVPAGKWVAEVPTAWSWEPARTIFGERKESGFVDEQLLSVTIGRGVIRQADLLSSTAKKDSSNIDKSKYKLVEPGDIVYNKMRAWQGASGGSVNRGIVSPAYIVMTPRAGLTEYFHHVLRTPMFAKEAERWSYGITSDQWSLRPEHFKMIRFPIPPKDEQAAIVKYLAHANARIDKAINAKRRLIALLEEQKRAVARELLSECAWPSWPVGRLGRMGNGSTPSRSTPAYWDGDVPWLNSSVVNREAVDSADQFVTHKALAECHLPLVPEGSVLVGITGQGKTRGMSTVLRMPATINQHIVFITPNAQRVSADYLSLALTVRYDELRRISDGSGGTKGALTISDLKAFRVPLPRVDEQQRILTAVRKHTADSTLAGTKAQREIALLQEFRTRLVADVVTGQIDVRAIAAALPDATEAVTDLVADSDIDLAQFAEGGDE